jgi:hypothetical protein
MFGSVSIAWAALLFVRASAAADDRDADAYFRELDEAAIDRRVDALGNPAAFESFAGGMAGALGAELVGFGLVLATVLSMEFDLDGPGGALLSAAPIVTFAGSGFLAGGFAALAGDAAGGDGSWFFAVLGGLLGASVAALLNQAARPLESPTLGWTSLLLLPPLAGGGAAALYELSAP